MKALVMNVVGWFERRLNLRDSLWPVMAHPVPAGSADWRGWFYVFGSATLTMLVMQIVTGILLAMVYVPSTDRAYESLVFLNNQQPLGWFIRALHFWSANGMIVMMCLHMVQVFLWGAYKYPRELTWIVGVVLFVLTLGMGYTGQVLRWDADAYWGLAVGTAIAGRVPIAGPGIVQIMLGGPIIGAGTLSRFFALHVFIIPGTLLFFLVVHLYLVVKKGISEPPNTAEPVDPKTYDRTYHEELAKSGVPFFPDAFYRDGTFAFLAVLAVVALAAFVGPNGPNGLPDPTLIQVNPRPEWYFLPLFGVASLSPAGLEDFVLLAVPPIILTALIALPLVAGRGQRAPSRRPVAVMVVVVAGAVIGIFGWLGHTANWSPIMTAWSGMPVPERMIKGLTPRELQGAVVFQNKDCRNCHALDGEGGRRGPDLTYVRDRLRTRGELIRQVVQGGGNMPAYGRQLSPAEVETLVSFLETLHRPKPVTEEDNHKGHEEHKGHER
jgi:ubiquinol-cytochrome c reductase cytochrome b subunit